MPTIHPLIFKYLIVWVSIICQLFFPDQGWLEPQQAGLWGGTHHQGGLHVQDQGGGQGWGQCQEDSLLQMEWLKLEIKLNTICHIFVIYYFEMRRLFQSQLIHPKCLRQVMWVIELSNKLHRSPEISIDLQRSQWISIDVHRSPQNSREINGPPNLHRSP